MIDDQPGTPSRSEKLVLPAINDGYSSSDQHTQWGQAFPQRPTPHKPVPPPPLASSSPFKGRNWRKDPAYLVLLIAICTLLIAGIVFAVVASNIFSQGNGPSGQSGPTTSNTGATPRGTLDTNPRFPTPGGNQGGSTSSQPPKTSGTPVIQSTPTLAPTPTTVTTVQPTPTQGQQNGQLTLQITGIQTPIPNDNLDPVTVTTSQPNIAVRLVITYNAPPGLSSLGPQMTDGGGNVTFNWFVSVRAFGHNHVTAHVMAVARDQNGQEVTSQTMTVQILVRGIDG